MAGEERLDGQYHQSVERFGALAARLCDQGVDQVWIAGDGFESERVHGQLSTTEASPASEFTSAVPGYWSR